MPTFNDSILMNINSYGLIPTLAMSIFFCIAVFIYSLIFHRVRTILYVLMLQINMIVYLSLFFILINSVNPSMIFILARLIYVSLLILSIISIYTISYITDTPFLKPKLFVLISVLVLTILTYCNDKWIITRDIVATTYYTAVKGPLFPLFVLYDSVIAIILTLHFISLFKSKKNKAKLVWPIYAGVLFTIINTDIIGILLVVKPQVKPALYLNSLVFTVFIMIYLFKVIHEEITQHEYMYLNYIYDELTQVHTRSYILENIESSLENPYLKHHYLIMIDMDNFKQINDTYGHIAGDELLAGFGQLLKECSPDHFRSGRLGGDEFIIHTLSYPLDQVLHSIDDLLVDYQKLTRKVTGFNNDHPFETGLSIGIIELKPFMNTKSALTKADKAMYKAKKSGKNCYIVSTT